MWRQLAALCLILVFAVAIAQEKVPAPKSIRLPLSAHILTPDQVLGCLDLAQRISALADHATVANARNDIDAFNSTVAPYNQAKDEWNAGCVTPYDPADMIRAENKRGVRFCTLTRTPCLSEAQRAAILAHERGRQDAALAAAPRARITRGTAVVAKPRVVAVSQTEPATTDALAWWLTREIPALGTTYHSVPTQSLDVPLERLSLLSCDPSSTQFTAEQCAEVAANEGQFRSVEDLDGDGREELLETAVGKTPDGRQVAVLIVSSLYGADEPQLFLQDGPGFSALFHADGRVMWFNCIECGHGFELSVDPETHKAGLQDYTSVDASGSSRNEPAESPESSDLDASKAWEVSQNASGVALAAVQRRYGKNVSSDKLAIAVDFQTEVYKKEVAQLVRSALPAAEPETITTVALRIVHSQDAGLSEAMETVCVPDMMKGSANPVSDVRCEKAMRDGFVHAYQRRQQLEAQ